MGRATCAREILWYQLQRMVEAANVRLSLSNRPENVSLVRQALGGVAEAVGLDALALNDINTAVTEACNNVAVHAYGGAEGPLEIDVRIPRDRVEVLVEDRGVGIPRDPGHEDAPGLLGAGFATSGGIGLSAIRALSHRVEFRSRPGGGTGLLMEFAAPHAGFVADATGADPLVLPPLNLEQSANAIAFGMTPPALARAVLPRLLSAMAARVHFSIDRISDARLLARALLAESDGSIDARHLLIVIAPLAGGLELRLGPLTSAHAAEPLLAATVSQLGPSAGRILDAHRAMTLGSHEMLALDLRQPR